MVANAQAAAPVNYTDDPVRGFALASVVWGVVGMLVVTWSLVQPGADDATERGRALYAHTVRSVMALRGKAVSRTMPPASTIRTSWRWPVMPFSRPRLPRAVGAQRCVGGRTRLAVR